MHGKAKMLVIAVNGPVGVGSDDVRLLVAGLPDAGYVDRLIFAKVAKRISSTVETLTEKEERMVRLPDRIAFFRNFFKVHTDDQSLHHLCLNMDRMKVSMAAGIVAHVARELQA